MRERVKKVITHPLFSGSAIMIVGTNGIAGLNYIYHLQWEDYLALVLMVSLFPYFH